MWYTFLNVLKPLRVVFYIILLTIASVEYVLHLKFKYLGCRDNLRIHYTLNVYNIFFHRKIR